MERRDFFGVEAEVSALAGLDLPASALVAASAEEDFFERVLFLVVEEEAELSAAAVESAESDFLDLLLDFDLVELSAALSVAESAESAFFDLDFELDFEAELSAVASLVASESDFFDFDFDFDLEAVEEPVSLESED